MARLDQVTAQKLIAALDEELLRRLAKRDSADDQRWHEEFGGDDVIMLASDWLEFGDRLRKARPSVVQMSGMPDRELSPIFGDSLIGQAAVVVG